MNPIPSPDDPASEAIDPEEATGKSSWLNILIAAGVIAAIVAAFIYFPIGEWLRNAISWVESLGFWAPLAFIAIYIICVVLFVPGSVLTAGAGAIFGVVQGSLYVSVASVVGATLAFLIGRRFARSWVEKRIAGNQTFASIDSAVAGEGWKIVLLTRLSPVFPFNFLNYSYGLTQVKLHHYVLASWIGMFPGTVLYVYIGSLGKAAAEAEGKSTLEWVLYGVGLLATLLVTLYVTKIARRALNKKISTDE